LAEAKLQLAKEDKLDTEERFRLATEGTDEPKPAMYRDLQRKRLKFIETEREYAQRHNALKRTMAQLAKKQSYEKTMGEWELKRKLDDAQSRLLQVNRENESRLATARATATEASNCLKIHEQLLTRYRDQLEECRLFAPTSGLVVYRGQGRPMGPGYVARRDECVLVLPDLNRMQVEINVQQGLLDRMEVGMPARIRVVALPSRAYTGAVKSIGVLPTPTRGSRSAGATYRVTVAIDDDVTGVVPGMSAEVHIELGVLSNVLTVPLQAVVDREDGASCYVFTENGTECRHVRTGVRSSGHVEICDGLVAGEEVVITPEARGG
jgi:RND family efflux transporter MFP subunit